MTKTRDIYLLNPKTLSPEVIAVAFAKTSRSPDSFRDIAAELTDEKSAEFHEKWVVGYGHACYDELTEVLTEDGWHRWCEVAENWHSKPAGSTRLATLNPETGFLEYLAPLRVIAEPYQGLMYRVRAKAVDLCVTPNHRMWVCITRTRQGRCKENYQLIPASELEGVPCVYQLSAQWEGPGPTTIPVGGKPVNACALMRLVGFFIGDGYHDRRYHNAASFNLRKQRETTFLRRAVEDCGFEWKMHGKKHYVTGPGLGDFLEQCYDDQRRKIIPRKLLHHGSALLSSLMEGFLHSDGSVDKGNHAVYDTTSEPLKDQLYELALKLGWAAYAIGKQDARAGSRQVLYRVHFNRTRLKPEVNKVSYRKQDGWEPYQGMVYCAEMPRNHILYVRRNGRPVWSGNSVAEHAVLHIAIENVSRLAVECIESNRLAAYTEKSTRYQVFDRDGYFTPPNVAASPHADLYHDTIRALFDAYFDSIEPVRQVIRAKYPRKEGEGEKKYEGRIRSKWIDNCRFLLPAATLANLGMTANARVMEHAITKMLSHPLEEVHDIGAEVKRVALAEVPTLVKYAERSDYLAGLEVRSWKSEVGGEPSQSGAPTLQPPISNLQPLTLINYDRDAEAKFVAACLYRASGSSFAEALACARSMTAAERAQAIDATLGGRGDFDIPLRELEHVTYTFDCVMDNGAYFDVKRHRMMTQTPQALTVDLSYAIPRAIDEAGFRERYCRALDRSVEAYRILASDFPHEASYLVANAFNRRVLLTLNLRELFHFCRLRGAPNGHFSYRRIAMHMVEILREAHPVFAQYTRCETYPSSNQIEGEFFVQV